MIGRLAGVVSLEWRVQWRYGVPAGVLGLAVLWSVVVAVGAGAAAPWVLFVEVMTVGALVVGALTVLERSTGVAAALRVTPSRPVERVVGRLACVVLVTTVGAVPLLLAGDFPAGRVPVALVAVALGSVLVAAIGSAVASRTGTVLGFLSRVPWPLLPLLGVPLAVGAGLVGGAGWFLVPTTGVLALLLGSAGPPAWLVLAYAGGWAAAAVWAAAREPRSRPRRRSGRGAGARRAGFVRADARNVARDSMLVPIVLSPVLLGVAVRLGYPPLRSWLVEAHGVGLDPYRSVLALLVVVLHVPLIAGMVGALLVLDDADDGVVGVVRVSPLGVRRYLAYRLGAVAVGTAVGLGVAAPLSGLVPGAAWPAVVLAIPVGPLFTVAVLASAAGRVGGVTASKLLGFWIHVPLAAWWLTGPAGWLLAPLPTFWVVRGYAGAAPVWWVGGVLVMAGWLVVLTRQAAARLDGQARTAQARAK